MADADWAAALSRGMMVFGWGGWWRMVGQSETGAGTVSGRGADQQPGRALHRERRRVPRGWNRGVMCVRCRVGGTGYGAETSAMPAPYCCVAGAVTGVAVSRAKQLLLCCVRPEVRVLQTTRPPFFSLFFSLSGCSHNRARRPVLAIASNFSAAIALVADAQRCQSATATSKGAPGTLSSSTVLVVGWLVGWSLVVWCRCIRSSRGSWQVGSGSPPLVPFSTFLSRRAAPRVETEY